MNTSNDQTLQSYEAHVQEYIDGTPNKVAGAVKQWLDEALANVQKDARILEIGSAFGRDAAYLQQKGYAVECTDATPAFVELLQQKGFSARLLNVITDVIEVDRYNLILANAVLLHFTREETTAVVKKVYDALKRDGIFAFSLKLGEGEVWSEEKLGAPRYFCFWNEVQITDLLRRVGFGEVTVNTDTGSSAKWVRIIAHK